ncbi:hypothetical protein lerEdw1_009429 [Lerista edwardsae]|nr:hypothetical protein lerEdw1_009429 [Lerista edwardsae]
MCSKEERWGGRLATLNMHGQDYEVGGDIIHPKNLHMKRFAEELGLSTLKSGAGLLGVYSGEEVVFKESSCDLWTIVKLLWRYGLDPLRIYAWVQGNLSSFMRIYHHQSRDLAFSTNEGLLYSIGGDKFLQMLNQSMGENLKKDRYSQKFIRELVTPVTRFNYGQGATVNSFAGFASFLGVDSGLWSVEGGNKLVCVGLLSASKAQLISGAVLSVELKTQPKGRSGEPAKLYEVTYLSESGVTTALYDILLIATPLQREIANITFQNFNPPIPEFSRPYHQTVTTLVHGRINTTFFGYRDPSQFDLNNIFTMENPKIFMDSIVIHSPVQKTTAPEPPLSLTIWRVLSHEPLTKEQLSLLFVSYDSVEEKKWQAYPRYSPPEKTPPIILHDRMYYLNGIELTTSAMEISAIAAKNAALLAHHRWYKTLDKVDQEGL